MRIKLMPNFKDSNPPPWLERNPLFRKAYIMRRLLSGAYGSRRIGSLTDQTIGRTFDRLHEMGICPKEGFYVDVGCFDPVKDNTTWHLYKKGWSGINIDIDAYKIEAFNMRRPRDTNIVCAVSGQTGEMEYWRRGLWSIYNSLETPKQEAEPGWIKMKVRADTLTNLIAMTKFKEHAIDFLSIDVEGHDLAVLQSLDFERYQPKVICVESWAATLGEVVSSDLYRFCVDRNYVLVNWVSANLIFLHGDLPAWRA